MLNHHVYTLIYIQSPQILALLFHHFEDTLNRYNYFQKRVTYKNIFDCGASSAVF